MAYCTGLRRMRTHLFACGLLSLAACHPGDHGSWNLQKSAFPVHAALASAAVYQYPVVTTGSMAIRLYEDYVTCDGVPRCGYRGALVQILHRGADGGVLEAESGRYEVVSQFSPADGGVEVHQAVVADFSVSSSNRGAGRATTPRPPFSEIGCIASAGSFQPSGSVTLTKAGNQISAIVDTPGWQGELNPHPCF